MIAQRFTWPLLFSCEPGILLPSIRDSLAVYLVALIQPASCICPAMIASAVFPGPGGSGVLYICSATNASAVLAVVIQWQADCLGAYIHSVFLYGYLYSLSTCQNGNEGLSIYMITSVPCRPSVCLWPDVRGRGAASSLTLHVTK